MFFSMDTLRIHLSVKNPGLKLQMNPQGNKSAQIPQGPRDVGLSLLG